MRKIFTKTALLAFCLFLCFSAKAQTTFDDGDYTFSLISADELTVSVKKFNNTTLAGAVAIPASVSHDGKPYTVTAIGDYAFKNCSGLTPVTIPNSVTSIGNSAFNGCKGLTSVMIPDKVISIGFDAFANCSGLTSVMIPDKVTSIGSNAFGSCYRLRSIAIPDNVTSISDYVFYGCTALETVTIGNSVESIGDYAFYDCKAIRTVYSSSVIAPTWIGTKFEQDVYDKGTLNIPIGAEASYKATAGWSEFKTVVAESTVEDITYRLTSADEHTVSIKKYNNTTFNGEVNIPLAVYFNGMDYAVTAIGDNAFERCTGLTLVTITDNITSIGARAFYECEGLTSITIPNSVTSIGESAFDGCEDTGDIKIGNGITEIPSGAFRFAHAGELTIGKSVTLIRDGAFPSTVVSIISRNTKPPLLEHRFDHMIYEYARLWVRPGALEAYKIADGWKEFSTIVEGTFVGVDEVDSKVVRVFANGGYINVAGVEDNTPIAIYTLQGSLIYSGTCDSTSIEAPGAGLYIARIAGKSYKIIVQ